ncbi:MAG: UDP-3-O-(3-hydroxymyristoyl)glucosamine N-acyltransferase [Flavobacteriaceae bacterium]|jgi:UDP-3-O-[3-hydroxymyristoyl] glucosamine N-acyltransferase|nr:UDP-3-O-(3-hydroxymyristoyl)glucosamine N-acyltransferase [Flavobacteriaceae bacterium]MBT3919050.1 UDP-3-O-(3-hydroxymyristoyl)glucosamine N-acyltransferase [Flavobacteriaceae bacterium]MBT6705150.1 UDP-3-O-(3-hydroxymyristoyl)glucosamine N-acyltransferase [Flavobacteriaceae bacterium]MBT7242273.1 UDP-3-O-(3-hydroxymyristoyl)glucosamine N-acyltransferase [Flavobacteriaceae bacterium]
MKFYTPQTIEGIARILNCDYIGDAEFPVLGMNEIHMVASGDIVFVDHPKYYDKALASKATIILINKEVSCPDGKSLLISDDPFRDFNKLTNHFNPFIAATATISISAIIGNNTVLQPNVFIGNNVQIGNDCIIHSNVCIYDNAIIGNNVTIHSGTILGADAFYYKNRPEKFDKLLSGGNVVIEDQVDIGALCTIDKGVTASTTIGKGSKIDNQVHIGHDTVIGKRCLIASQVGISGCVIIEDFVTIWGQAGVTSGVTIGEKAVISAQSGVSKSLEGHKSYFGTPADDFRKKYKEIAAIRLIPEIMDKLDKLK